MGILEFEGSFDFAGEEKLPDLEYLPFEDEKTISELVELGVLAAIQYLDDAKLYHPNTPDGHPFEDTRCIHETPKALLVELQDGAQVWLPKSQVLMRSPVRHHGDVGELFTTGWFASKLDPSI